MENNYENSYTLRQSGQQVQELLDYVEEHRENIGDRLKVAEVNDGASLATSTNVAGAMGWYVNLASGTYTPITKYEESGSYQDGQYVWQLVNDSPNIFKYPNLAESVHNPDFEFTFSLDSAEASDYTKLALNDEVSWKADYSGNFFGTITNINGQGSQITVTLKDKDNVPTNFIPQIYCVAGGSIPEGKDRGYLWAPSKPTIGKLKIGAGAAAVGFNTVASEMGAFATGLDTLADGRYSTAEGRNTKASYAAHAEGYENEALGYYSHVEGRGNKSDRGYTHVQGKYADTSTKNYVDVIGWGTSSAPKNLETLDDSGNLHIKGDMYVHAKNTGEGGLQVPLVINSSIGYQDVKYLIDKHYAVILIYDKSIYQYSGYYSNKYYFFSMGTGASNTKTIVSVDSNNVWKKENNAFFLRLENGDGLNNGKYEISNVVNTSSKDTQIPTAKAVNNYFNGKKYLKVTDDSNIYTVASTISESNSQIPTSKAIVNYLTTSRFEGGQVAYFKITEELKDNVFASYLPLIRQALINSKGVILWVNSDSCNYFLEYAFSQTQPPYKFTCLIADGANAPRYRYIVVDPDGTFIKGESVLTTNSDLNPYVKTTDLSSYTKKTDFNSLDDIVTNEDTGLVYKMDAVQNDISDIKAELEGVEANLADLHNGGTA